MPHKSPIASTFPAVAAVLLWSLMLVSCGSSGQTYTSPSTIAKCAIGFEAPTSTVSADGGSGAIPVKAERECQWTATPDVPWLSITVGSTGQGDGTVQFVVAANAEPVPRTGGIMLNGLRAQVAQAAAPCTFTLASNAASFSQSGGTGRVDVRASNAQCTWTATSDAGWIAVTSGAEGKGSSTVSFNVAPASGPPRTGSLTIAGLPFTVTQSEGCTYAISPTTYAAGAAGGSNSVAVTADPGCPWTATTEASWISLATTSGSGSGAVPFTVAATTGPSRSGIITIAGQLFTVTQSPGCGFDVAPLNHAIGAAGGTGTVNVSAAAGCAWTASSNVPWIAITGGANGSGGGTVTFTVAATTGTSRTGTITVGGQTVTVVQGQGCNFAVSPETHTVAPSGGSGTVAVSAGAGCAWTASSNAPWITITSGATGSGSGTVAFTAASTTGPSRSGTMTVAGRNITIVQGQGCTYAIAPDTQSVPASGGDGAVTVSAGAGCAWTASSNASWITIASGASGSGNGAVSFKVAATNGPARSGSLTIAGRTFTVNQGADCTIALSSSSSTQPAAGGTGTFEVRTAAGCAWTAATSATWLSITSGASGQGTAAVGYAAAANTGPQRTGTITAGGQTFTVEQAGGCTFTLSASTQRVPAGGAPGSFAVNTAGACAWTATSNAPWIAITSGGNGTGPGTVQFTAAANTAGVRSGTITAAGQTFTITQDASCNPVVGPETIAAPATAGSHNVSVTTAAECSWTAVSNTAWIAVAAGAAGSGNGAVQLDVQSNSGPARTGTATVAGRTVTVNQESGCAFSIAPPARAMPLAGGSGSVTVMAGGDCAWTAVSTVPWVTVTRGASGAGDGIVEFTVDANAGPARRGTITIAGQTFTIDQGGT